MSRIAEIRISVVVTGTNGALEEVYEPGPIRFAPAVLQRQTLALANGANTVTVPTGAKFVLLILNSVLSLTIKGISGDTGIPLTPSSAPLGIPGLFPLNAATSFVITNGTTAQSIDALFL